MTTVNPDTDNITSEPTKLTLSNGLVVKVERLKTRATLALLRILSRGAGDMFRNVDLDPDSGDFRGQLIASVLFAIPEAPEETLQFIQIMVTPAQLREVGKINAGDKAWNDQEWVKYDEALRDPELDDLIDIVTEIVENEADHIQALGKRLMALIPTAQRREAQTNNSDSTTPSSSLKRSSKGSTRTAS